MERAQWLCSAARYDAPPAPNQPSRVLAVEQIFRVVCESYGLLHDAASIMRFHGFRKSNLDEDLVSQPCEYIFSDCSK